MRALALAIVSLMQVAAVPSAPVAPRVVALDLHDTIQPASLRYIERGLREAAARDAALVIIELDTPGGLLESLRSMTSAILGSPVPVAVYVTPSGARAASAGFFLLLASDIAAMAPGTNTGAAHPVTIGARRQTGDEEQDNGADDASLEKLVEDAAAFARALATRRNRSVEAAEQAVRASASFAAEEARTRGLIDIVAIDRDRLLRALDGRSITRFDGRTATLDLHGAEVIHVQRTFAERILTVIASPQIAYLLLMLGAMGLLFELMAPGGLVPGIAGGLSVVLGLYGLSVLPVSVSGALLIVAGFALLVAEVFVVSYGVLAVAGITSFVVGSLILIEAPVPELRIGPEVVIPVTILLGAVAVFLAVRGLRSRRMQLQSGVEMMVGERAEVVDPIEPGRDGRVFVHGEYWAATSRQPLPKGANARIEAIVGLRLRVAPLPALEPREGMS